MHPRLPRLLLLSCIALPRILPGEDGRRVSLTLSDEPAAAAVEKACRAAGTGWVMGPEFLGAAEGIHITADYCHSPLNTVVSDLLRRIGRGAEYTEAGGVCAFYATGRRRGVEPRNLESGPDCRNRLVSLRAEGEFHEALSALFDAAEAGYVIRHLPPHRMAVILRDVPLREAVGKVIEQSRASLPFEAYPALFVIPSYRTAGSPLDPQTARLSLRLEKFDLRYALKSVMAAMGANFALDQSVQGVVSAWLPDVTVDRALRSLLAVGGEEAGLTYRTEDGVYLFAPLRSVAPPA